MDWKRWMTPEPPTPPPAAPEPPPMIDYTDGRSAELVQLKHDLATVNSALTDEETHWNARQGDDPATFVQRTNAAPRVLALRAEVQRLSVAIAALERDIASTADAVREYAALTDREAQILEPLLARLPSDAELEHAYRASQQIEQRCARLLAATGDRTAFRRPRTDPRRALSDALDDRLQHLRRLHLVRSAQVLDKTGTS